MSLRDYQQYIYDECQNAIRQGHKGILVCLPCRSGKSYIFAEMIRNLKQGYALVLAHRRELLRQHEELLTSIPHDKYRLESVFTEVNHVSEHEPPTIIIIDEAHLSEAASYKRVCESYPSAIRIGFTATPQRLSGEPLSLYSVLIQGIGTKELIERKAISEFDYYAPDIGLDLSAVSTVAGEYNNKELTDVMCQSRLYGDFIKAYQSLADGKQAVAYCVSKKHAVSVCNAFNESGVSAVEIDSSDSVSERIAVINAFKNGEFKILCNCNLFSEGITLPEADVVMMLRPTQSLALFIQQGMRALTPREGKRAVVIDCVGNYQRHGLLDDDREWSINGRVKHKVTNPDGSFSIRTCSECFRVYPSRMSVCPYCGTAYVVKGRELRQVKEVQLRQIKAEEAEALKREKKKMRMEVGRCKTMADLWKIAHERGYAPGWVYITAQKKGIRR